MEVKVGYKQTDIGVIPEEWSDCDIGDLNPFITSGSRGWAKYYSEKGAPFIRITNLSRESIDLNLYDLKYVVNPLDASDSKRTELKTNDVLISITADIGIIGYVNDSVEKPSYINQHIALVRFSSDKVNSRFIGYYLASENAQKNFRSSKDLGAKAGMNLLTVRKIRIPLPSYPEQCAIATTLSDVDALIASLDRLIAKTRDIKQASMQELLTGKRRLPGFSGEWEVRPLREIASVNMGQSPDSQNYNIVGQGIPLIQGNADIESRKSIRRVWTTQITKECDEGDLILTVRAPVGSVGLATEHSCIGRGVCSLKSTGVDTQFLYHALIFAERDWKCLEQGSTFTSANSAQIAAFALPVAPSKAEQTSIATVLSDIDAKLNALEQNLEKTKAIKQGMMQELLTGRISLI